MEGPPGRSQPATAAAAGALVVLSLLLRALGCPQETCLVAKPPLPFAVLKRRLERRCAALGIKVRGQAQGGGRCLFTCTCTCWGSGCVQSVAVHQGPVPWGEKGVAEQKGCREVPWSVAAHSEKPGRCRSRPPLRTTPLLLLTPSSLLSFQQVKTVHEEEWSYIPVGGPLPVKDQPITAFGAAANLVHPATGGWAAGRAGGGCSGGAGLKSFPAG